MEEWVHQGYNAYGGPILTHPAGWVAIGTFNAYGIADGFSVRDPEGIWHRVRRVEDLP